MLTYFHCVCDHAVIGLPERQPGAGKKRDERLQLQGGDGASKGIQPSVSSPDMKTLTVVVTGRGCQTRPPGAPPPDGLPLELREACQDGSSCHSQGAGGAEEGHHSGHSEQPAAGRWRQRTEVQARQRPRWRPRGRRRRAWQTSMADNSRKKIATLPSF